MDSDSSPRSLTDAPPRSSTDAGATSSGSKAPKKPTVRRIGKRVANLPAGTKFTVKFDYTHQPVGEYKPDYVTRQGAVVRNTHITSLAYKTWPKVPQEMKQKMMDVVLEKFEIGDFAERLDLLEKSLAKKWKDFKVELKYKYWSGGVSDEVNISNIPPGVSEADWTWLVQYWGQEEVQELCRKNKEHRSVQQMHHRTGRKSFVIADNEAGSSGLPFSRLKMFELAYGKNESYKEGYTQEKADELYDLRVARVEGLNTLTDDEIFKKVFGDERPGRLCCMGSGHTQTSRWGKRPSRVEFERDREERMKQKQEIARRQTHFEARLEEERQRDRLLLEEERQRDRLQLEEERQWDRLRLEEERQRDSTRLEAQFEERIRQMQAAQDEQMQRMMDEFSRRIMHMQQPPS